MNESPSRRVWPDHRAVWRWHFYAGLFCIPFVVVLSLSGAVYLFKEEIEAWAERRFDTLAAPRSALPPSAQVTAALESFPGSRFEGYELPAATGHAARVLLRHAGDGAVPGEPQRPGAGTLRTYVDPVTAKVLGSVWEKDRLMKLVFRLHGELLMGNRGSNVVELAACWTVVMVLTGLVLWWPRNRRGLAGVLWPRVHGGRRLFWRDIHAVTAAWLSVVTLLFIASGLPWAKAWGDWLKTARRWTGTAVVRQEWSNEKGRGGAAERPVPGGGHGVDHGGGRGRAAELGPDGLAALDRVAAVVAPLGIAPPVVLAPTGGGPEGRWTAKSMTANRPRRVNLVIDSGSGGIVSRDDFSTKHPIDKTVAVGIALHEGRLFGWPNQLLGLLTALGLVVVCGSAVWLWLARRDPASLGAPPAGASPRWSTGLVAVLAALGVALPLFGASLVAVLLLERLVLRRIPPLAAWLGIAAHGGGGPSRRLAESCRRGDGRGLDAKDVS